MKIKAKDMCPRCKYYLGMTPQGMYSCGKADDGSELNIGIDVILNCANFEWKDGKVEGKVADFCPKCKKDWLIEVECEDPYDGMIKTLDADSDICCSMFEPKPDRSCAKCERFDGTYCHGPNGTITISYKALFGEPVNCPSFNEKKDHEIELEDTNEVLYKTRVMYSVLKEEKEELEKEKAAHMKGIERLKKANNNLLEKCNGYIAENAELTLKCKKTREAVVFRSREIDELQKENEKLKNQIKNLQYLNEEGYKREDKLEKDNHLLESKLDKLGDYYRTNEKLIDNIQKVIFPQEEGSDYTYSYEEILNKVKELKEELDKKTKINIEVTAKLLTERDKLKNENTSLNTINKGLAEDRKKLINYMRSLKIASENYLKEFTYGEESNNE